MLDGTKQARVDVPFTFTVSRIKKESVVLGMSRASNSRYSAGRSKAISPLVSLALVDLSEGRDNREASSLGWRWIDVSYTGINIKSRQGTHLHGTMNILAFSETLRETHHMGQKLRT